MAIVCLALMTIMYGDYVWTHLVKLLHLLCLLIFGDLVLHSVHLR